MRTQLFIAAIFFLQSLFSIGQIQLEMEKINVDSLQQVLPGLDGTEKVDALNKLSLGLCRYYPDSSMSLANQTIALSEKLDYQKGLADGHFNLGNYYFYMDSIKPMALNYLDALRIFEELKPGIQMGMTLYQLAILNRLTGRYEKAKAYCKEAIHTYQLIGEHRHEVYSLHTLGGIYRRNEEWDSTLFFYDKALGILDSYPDNWIRGDIYNDYGLFYLTKAWKGDKSEQLLQKGIPWFYKCWELNKKYHHHASDMATPIYNIGSFYISTGSEENIIKGIEYINLAKSIVDTTTTCIHIKIMAYRLLALEEKRKGNLKEAITLFKKGISELDKSLAKFSIKNYHDPQFAYIAKYNSLKYKSYCYTGLYNIYKETGDYKNALEYYILKEKAADKVLMEENSNLIAMLEADSENEKIEKQIAINASHKDIRLKRSKNFNIGVGILFIILVFVGVLFLRQHKLKNEHKSVVLKQKLLRLQMNPHFIFNSLSNILHFINSNENKKASGYLTNFCKLLRTTLENTRRKLLPFEKEVNSLKNYLELQKLLYSNKFDYHIQVDINIDTEDMSIPPMLVQPFVENAIEHGIRHKTTPGRIDIRFFLKDKIILCEVEDNGVGRKKARETEINKRKGQKSLTTAIINDRIKTLNKKLKQKIRLRVIDKISNNYEALGTKVLIDLPYENIY